MRIRRLDLKAFGPFTDQSLVFAAEQPGLHIIFGPNEAGKSSSLRGLKALLCGFPERTADNFLHANDQLLVGGSLEAADGRILTFCRRKRRKADLLDAAGNPLDPAAVEVLLHGMSPDVFDSLYGIDHERLVQGGADILAQKGEVGQALFAAGAGISSLHAILEELRTEADELFKPRGARQAVNQALAEYRELQKRVREASLSGREWKEHRQRYEEAEKRLATVEAERNAKDAERRRLDRLQQALPSLALRRSLEEQLQDLGAVVLLPADFAGQWRRLEEKIRAAEHRAVAAAERLRMIAGKQASLPEKQPLLGHAGEVAQLLERLGEYRKSGKDRPRLDGMRIGLRSAAAGVLRQIRSDLTLDMVETLRPLLRKRQAIQYLSGRHEALTQKMEFAAQEYRGAKQEAAEKIGRAHV